MTRDLIIGLIVSISLHAGVFLSEKLFPKEAEVVSQAVEEEFTVELMEMPRSFSISMKFFRHK